MTRRAMLAWMMLRCPLAVAAEPCAWDESALLDALRADDPRRAAQLLSELGAGVCAPEHGRGPPARLAWVEALRESVPRAGWGRSWVPSVGLTAAVSPGWSAASRVDGGRALDVGVRWSVGVGLTFRPRADAPPEGASLSRGEARAWVGGVDAPAWALDTLTAEWRVDALARWAGEQLTDALALARRHHPVVAELDLRGRVLVALEQQEALARLTVWSRGEPSR